MDTNDSSTDPNDRTTAQPTTDAVSHDDKKAAALEALVRLLDHWEPHGNVYVGAADDCAHVRHALSGSE